jgi:hypothetical protein
MSKTWTFFGVIHPERVPVTLPAPIKGRASSSALAEDFEFDVRIHASQIIIDLVVESDEADIATLRSVAVGQAEILTHLIGYNAACCSSVEIKSAVCQSDQAWQVFGIDIPVLSKAREGKPMQIESAVLQAVGANPEAQMVLGDFTNAMRFPVGTGFYCYRAIEAMMQFMKESEGEDEKKAWPRLRERLRVERAAIDAVKAHADLPRHGKPSTMLDADRVVIFKITDEIVRRFLVYLKSSQQPLPAGEFEVLTAQVTESETGTLTAPPETGVGQKSTI